MGLRVGVRVGVRVMGLDSGSGLGRVRISALHPYLGRVGSGLRVRG